eukprot:gene8145-9015_t
MENDMENFKTPSRLPPARSKLNNATNHAKKVAVSPVTIPPSPMMKKLGWGTGVVVYRLDRSSSAVVSGGAAIISKSPWAVKKAKKSKKEPMKRLIKEAEILRRLDHPNIVGFRKISQLENGDTCLSMEEGGTDLGTMIEAYREDQKQFTALEVSSMIVGAAKALSYLHNEHNILHGDIKSGNILISDSFQKVKLCDFGVSLVLKDDLSGPLDPNAFYIGSEPWCSIEALNDGPITDKADIFSFGLVIWEMLALETPHINLMRGENEDLDGSYCSSADVSDCDGYEEYYSALGTRPPLPNRDFDSTFMPIVGVFACCTVQDYRNRPSAKQVLQAFAPTAKQLNIPGE